MSKADKMFEDLGFEKEEMPEIKRIEYKYMYEDTAEGLVEPGSEVIAQVIIFELDMKTVAVCDEVKCGDYLSADFGMKDLQAINEKAKELGWLEC